ncbi:MAG: hypothetical protein JXB48_24775, partial [Candidatus Latescibacteria bacterium]|nr:hypothetical protein [Candidatus Latescibacterota bacterium]
MSKKLVILCKILLLIPNFVIADQLWTSWYKVPEVLSVAFEDSIVWCATNGEGVFSYNTITGEQQRYITDDGLAGDIVYCIAVNNNGEKWFGTIDGISQFDGSQWTTHYSFPFYDMAIDQNNSIWAITSNNIYTYDGVEFKKIENIDLNSIEISTSGNIWIAGDKKIVHIKDSNISEIIIHDIAAARDYIKDISVDDTTDKLWYTCTSKIYSYDFETGTETVELDDTTPDYQGYTMIDVDADGNVWLARSRTNYIALYKDGALTNYYSDIFDTYTINDIAADDKGNVWISTEKGLVRFDGQNFETVFDEPEHLENAIGSIVIDNDDIVWCSHSSGSSCFKNGAWKFGTTWMGSLRVVDNNNHLWGCSSGNIYEYNGTEVIQHTIIVPLSGFGCETTSPGHVNDICFDNDKIWITSAGEGDCTRCGVFTYDSETVVPHLLDYFATVAIDSQKNVWCGALYKGLFKYDGNDWTHYNDTNGLPWNQIWNVEVDENDVVWFSMFHGRIDTGYHNFGYFDNNTFVEYTFENSGLPEAMIYTFTIDHNNTKWLGTDSGVTRFDGETWTTFNTQNSGLCCNKVNAIAVDNNNVLWFGTDKGVSRYTGEIITT